MFLPNQTIWQTRIQNIDALLTAGRGVTSEVYYLATVCQVGIDPPLISISPNPEYPICQAIETAGHFGINFLAEGQGELLPRYLAMDRTQKDKMAALGLRFEQTVRGTPLLLDCIQSLECVVERGWDSGDHRTFIGRVLDRRIREPRRHDRPHRFGGEPPRMRRLLKMLLCQSRIYDLLQWVRGSRDASVSIEAGTRRYIK